MTKPVGTSAVVKVVTGNPFEIQAKSGGVMLLSNNTVWLKNNYVLDNFLHDQAKREALIAAYDKTPMVTLEAATGSDGKALTTKEAPIMLHQWATGPYDPRKLGQMAIMDRDSLIIIHTHYHTSKGVNFMPTALVKALTGYCQLAALEGRRKDPIIIPMPGMDCVGVRVPIGDRSYTIDQTHAERVTKLIAETVFPDADITLVYPA